MTHRYSRYNSSANIFSIDRCHEGRIEHQTGDDMCYYMGAGDLRLDRMVYHSGDMYFSVSHYHGITVGFFLGHVEKSVREAMPGVSVYLAALDLSDHKDDRPYFYSSQAEKLKAVHKLLTDDLTRNSITEEPAKRFNLSKAALKKRFKGVYGSPIGGLLFRVGALEFRSFCFGRSYGKSHYRYVLR